MAKNSRIDRDWREPIRKSEIATDFGISLARIQWDLFATPTFKGPVPRSNIAYGMAFRWLQEVAKDCGVPYKRLLIALRGEEGEKNGRFHFHCLVGGTATRNYHTLQHQAEHLWKIQTGGARVDVRQYDRALAVRIAPFTTSPFFQVSRPQRLSPLASIPAIRRITDADSVTVFAKLYLFSSYAFAPRHLHT